MSKKVIAIIVIILVIIGIGWYVKSHPSIPATEAVKTTPTPTKTVAPEPVIQSVLTTPANDASDVALQNDLSNVDGQATGLSSDSANIDNSLTN